MTHESLTESHLPAWAYRTIGAITGVLGLAASAVSAQFFILGLERIEADPTARALLVGAGLLTVIVELACFGAAALLPTGQGQFNRLRALLLALGLTLLAFETFTIYTTQAALSQTQQNTALSSVTRIAELRTTIDSQRATATAMRSAGTVQSSSANAWTRQVGVTALKDAVVLEQGLLPLGRELAELQSSTRPTLAGLLGKRGELLFNLARSVLMSVMGLVMFSAAGTLLRAGSVERNGTVVHDRSPLTERSTGQYVHPTEQSLVAAEPWLARVSTAISCGDLRPSVRAVRAALGGSTASVQSALSQLERAGVLTRLGQGYSLR